MTAGYLETEEVKYADPDYAYIGNVSLGDTLVLKALNMGDMPKISIDQYIESRLRGIVRLDNMKSTTYYSLLRLVDRGYVVKTGMVSVEVSGNYHSIRRMRVVEYSLTTSGLEWLMLCEKVLNTVLEDD